MKLFTYPLITAISLLAPIILIFINAVCSCQVGHSLRHILLTAQHVPLKYFTVAFTPRVVLY